MNCDKKITYISYYSLPNDIQKRKSSLACVNKMNSIIESLVDIGYYVNIISVSNSELNKCCKSRTEYLSSKVTLQFFQTFPWTNILSKILCKISILGGLFFHLLKIKKYEKVIVYHSLDYMFIINLAHKIKKFHLILEIEEIYADVINNEKIKHKEIDFFLQADCYIFPTHLLNNYINIYNRPALIIHGTYKIEPCIKDNTSIIDGNFSKVIHCVYAGTLDPRKGGGVAAAAAAYLPENYHIHIIGFGSDEQVQEIKKIIYDINQQSKSQVTYDGIKQGDDYIKFIQSCDIGLSTQNPDASFNSTSFPSKILSYLANGLRVVSIKIPAVETSDVGDMLYYYDKQIPKNIAQAILQVDLKKEYDSRKRICELKAKFDHDLFNFLNNLNSYNY